MISRMTFCSAQHAMIRSARFGPMPVTSRRRLGRRHDVFSGRREEGRPNLKVEIVEAMGIGHLKFGDPVAQCRRVLRLGGIYLRNGTHSAASA